MSASRLRYLLLTALLLLSGQSTARAQDLVVIAHPDSGLQQLSPAEVSHLFLGRLKRLPSGAKAQPVDTTSLKAVFYARLIGTQLPEIDAYWARLMFSGNTRPPEQLPDSTAAVQRIKQQPGAVGYVERSSVTPGVRIVLELGPAQ